MVSEASSAVRRAEWRREAYTMAFYVAVCLEAALFAVDTSHEPATIGIIWGTTIGLALAHLFAFRLAARLVAHGMIGRSQAELAIAQLSGAVAVAVITTIPVLMMPASAHISAARFVLSAFIGLAAFAVGWANGAGVVRSSLFAGGTLLVAVAVAAVKNILLGH